MIAIAPAPTTTPSVRVERRGGSVDIWPALPPIVVTARPHASLRAAVIDDFVGVAEESIASSVSTTIVIDGRSSGRFARSWTISRSSSCGICAPSERGDGGADCVWCVNASTIVDAENGVRPTTISNSTQPSE